MSLDRIGKYRVVEKIGEGAMGEVYKAHDPLLNRHVALKTIAASLAADPQFRARFQREAQSAAGLNHPNIITIYDFGEEDGLTYMAMEFLEGVDLREAIRARTLGHLGRKIEVMEQICEGVAFAHARSVIHRDLKPGNIHIQPSGHVKILDFGLARLGASELTRTGTVMGTPHYMAPEQLKGQKADARSDVFSLGAIFYELLSGARAFEGQAMHEVLQRIRDRDPVPLRRRAPATPAALVEIVEKAMAREPEARYNDAGEISHALTLAREALAGETLAAPVAPEDASVRTLLQAETIVEPRPKPQPSVSGTSALDFGGQHEPSRTLRPDATVSAGPATEVPRRSRALVVGAATLALGAVALAVWLRPRPIAPGGATAPASQAAQDQLGLITDVVVTSKLELARDELQKHDYAAAAASAREALGFDATNAEARALIEEAERIQKELDLAVAGARAALARGDTKQAGALLDRVLALDPRHSVAAELAPSLNQSFRQQAEEARRQTESARAAAARVRATGQSDFAKARSLSAEAEALFRREAFTTAAQKFLESRAGFEAAGRTAEATRAAEQAARDAAAPRPQPTLAEALPTPALAPTVPPTPIAPSSVAPTSRPTSAVSVSTPSASAPLVSAPLPDLADAAVRRVIADYERALEGQDLVLYRSVMLPLSADQERQVREAFKGIKSQDVGMKVESVDVDVDGDRATVRVWRQDMINGRRERPKQQTIHLARDGGAWRIQKFGE